MSDNTVSLTQEQIDEILSSISTREPREVYEKRCITRLLDSDENFMFHCEEKFPGRAPASVKSQLIAIIKEKELPLVCNQTEEYGVFLLKVA